VQRCLQQCDLQLLDFFVEVRSPFWQKNRLLCSDAIGKHLPRQVVDTDRLAPDHNHESL
jgi:hypothetical protein